MKKIIFNLFFLGCYALIYAQTPNYNIVVTNPTNNDTMLMPLLGVISCPLPPPSSPLSDITPQLQDIGVTSIRNNDNYDDKLDMEALFRCDSCFSDSYQNANWVPAWCGDPNDPNNLHFEASDTLFRVIHNGGFNLFFRLGGESQSGLSYQHHVFQGPQDTIAENNWIEATIPVVEHYDNFEGNTNVLDYLDIWTEWPNGSFWQRSDDEFIWFFTKALDTLKTHFPNKKIGGPGFLVPTVFVIDGDVHNKATDLLTSLYQNNVKPDFISWHLWVTKPMDYYLAGENFKKLLDGAPPFDSVPWAGTGFFNGVEIICGAWGTPKLNLSDAEIYQLYNKQKGAAILSADWIAMQETNTVRAYYYRDADPRSNPDTTIGDAGASGIFYGDAAVTYKPKSYAFKLWSKIYNEFPQKLSCDFPVFAPDSSKLWVLVAQNNQNAFGVLISNTDSIEKSFTLNIQGQTVDTSNYDIYYYLVNDNENGNIEYQSYDNNFNIPVQSVEFVRILPKNYTPVASNKVSKLKLYPNPSTGIIYLENAQGFDVEVASILGDVVVKKQNINQNSITINLSNQAKGIYFVKCYNKNSNNYKVIKIVKN